MRIAVTGAAGRMGQMLVREVASTEGAVLAGGTERPGAPALGRDVAALAGLDPAGPILSADPAAVFAAADAVLDFTVPAASVAHAALAARHGTALIVGTTGLSEADEAVLRHAARDVPIVYAANYSVGVVILQSLVARVAAILGPDTDIEIVEMHHRHKVDAPSGTALALGKAAAAGRGVALDRVAARGRDGHTGPRRQGDIGFAVLRGGDVVGDHTVVFASPAERIELTHKAASRQIFARGAVLAALWSAGRPPGLYTMADVLGLA